MIGIGWLAGSPVPCYRRVVPPAPVGIPDRPRNHPDAARPPQRPSGACGSSRGSTSSVVRTTNPSMSSGVVQCIVISMMQVPSNARIHATTSSGVPTIAGKPRNSATSSSAHWPSHSLKCRDPRRRSSRSATVRPHDWNIQRSAHVSRSPSRHLQQSVQQLGAFPQLVGTDSLWLPSSPSSQSLNDPAQRLTSRRL